MRQRLLCAALLALTVLPGVARAQNRWGISGDVTTGQASGLGGRYDSRELRDYRMAFGIRSRPDSTVSFFAEGTANAILHEGCPPYRPCDGDYPELVGGGVAFGAAVRSARSLEARVSIGPFSYNVNNPRTEADGNFATWAFAFVGQVDLAVFPARHVGIVVGHRYLWLPNYNGMPAMNGANIAGAERVGTDPLVSPPSPSETLRISPWMVGLRIR